MISFFLTILKFFRAFVHAASDEEFRALFFVALTLSLSGTLFYVYAEDWGALDAFYFCIMTMTTIGYGDLVPTSGLSKVFTIIYAFLSIGVFVAMAAKLATSLVRFSDKTHKTRGPAAEEKKKIG